MKLFIYLPNVSALDLNLINDVMIYTYLFNFNSLIDFKLGVYIINSIIVIIKIWKLINPILKFVNSRLSLFPIDYSNFR